MQLKTVQNFKINPFWRMLNGFFIFYPP